MKSRAAGAGGVPAALTLSLFWISVLGVGHDE